MREYKGSVFAWFNWCMLVLCLSLFMASSVKADMGPKPNVTIKIKNRPEQEIVMVECLLYAFFMKQKNGKRLRIILYAIIANLVSMVTSLYVGGPLGTRILFFGFMIVAYIVALIICLHNEKKKENDEQI